MDNPVPPPVMTERVLQFVIWQRRMAVDAALHDSIFDDYVETWKVIECLVRSIVNGELVVVPRNKLERVATWLSQTGGMDFDDNRRLSGIIASVDLWLTPDTSQESKEECQHGIPITEPCDYCTAIDMSR
jgi:hypothetical protein